MSFFASRTTCFALGLLVFVVGDAAISWGKLRMFGYTLVNGSLLYDCRPIFNVDDRKLVSDAGVHGLGHLYDKPQQ